jgi:hypothetical protein
VGIPQINGFLEFLGRVLELPTNEKLTPDLSNVATLQKDKKDQVTIYSTMYKDRVITSQEYREGLDMPGEKPDEINETQQVSPTETAVTTEEGEQTN